MAEQAPPTQALDAVLVESVKMPEGSRKVEDFDFDKFGDRPMTAADLLQSMSGMGFQASSVGEAVRIINEMVSRSAPNAFVSAG
jgi:deoxyhypusine synthase